MAFYGGVMASGGADGSDTSFEVGAKIAYDALAKKLGLPEREYKHVLEVHLPWPTFNGRNKNPSEGYYHAESDAALKMASKFHPAWDRLGRGPRAMMSRNCMQAMGSALDTPARFTICETPDGAYTAAMTSSKTGGTGQAIRVSDAYGIKVYNLKNPDHLKRVISWIDDCEEKIYKKFGLKPKELVDDFLSSFKGIKQHQTGNLVEMANRGEIDVLVHGSNCFHMNSGIAKEIRNTFPEAYQSFLKTPKGDKTKLGKIDCVTVERNGKPVTIVNAFVQYTWGRDPDVLYVDYEKIRSCFEAVSKQFDRNVKIGIPRIGSGLGNGCWVTISNIINQQMGNHNLVLVDLPSRELDLHNDTEMASPVVESGDQMSLI